MKNEPKKVDRYGFSVWENAYLDKIRKDECLCLNCKNMPCTASTVLYFVCLKDGMAMAISRCQNWKKK